MNIELDNLSFEYRNGVKALGPVSLVIPGGTFVSICGRNGSGKSTLLKLLARVVTSTGGLIRIGERDQTSWGRREYARTVGYLPQENEALFRMKALDVVLSGRSPFVGPFGWESVSDLDAAERALERCDASALGNRYIDEMSGGERKRIFLARLVAAQPSILLLDEPLASLDLEHMQGLVRLLDSIRKEEGATIVLVSHDLNWSAGCSERMIVLDEGRVVLDAPPADLMRSTVMKAHFGFDALELTSPVDGSRWLVPAGLRSGS